MSASLAGLFWKPGTAAPGVDREAEKEGAPFVYNPNQRLSIPQQRTLLPIFRNRSHILYLLEKYQVVIIVGDTGCGKTTQVPQYLHEGGWTSGGRVVCCTQPRRVAAQTIAIRVADEMGVSLGAEVGYCIRFDDRSDAEKTRIKYMTDGMLMREMMLDPLLSRYSVIMIDEAHERTLYTEIILGLLKKIMKKRKELRVVLSSATIDAENFRDFFGLNAAIMTVEQGRIYPVDVHYLRAPCSDYVVAALNTVLEIHAKEPVGDILVFMTGSEEIDTLVSQIHDHTQINSKGWSLTAIPMYAAMAPEKQLSVFEPAPERTRKCVVATNVAETSVTIPGIVYVIDSGFVKLKVFNAQTTTESLVICPVSRSSAVQRAGRAGRIQAGKAYRMYTEEVFQSLPMSTVPEMQRTNMAAVVLQLKALGVDDVLHFHFLSPPPAETLARGLELLYALGALDDDCKLTDPLGIQMAEFPCEPQMTKMIITAAAKGCIDDVLTIAAMLSVQNVFLPDRDSSQPARLVYGVKEGDHVTLLNVYNAFHKHKKDSSWCQSHSVNYRAVMKAIDIRSHLKKYAIRFGLQMKSDKSKNVNVVREAIVGGYFANAARMRLDGSYATVRGDMSLSIHPMSTLFKYPPRWAVYHEVLETTKPFMRDAIAIEPQWLTDIAPHFYKFTARSFLDTHGEYEQQAKHQRI